MPTWRSLYQYVRRGTGSLEAGTLATIGYAFHLARWVAKKILKRH